MKLALLIFLLIFLIFPSSAVNNAATRRRHSQNNTQSPVEPYSKSHFEDYLKISDQATKISASHPGAKEKKALNIKEIPITSLDPEHITSAKINSYTKHLFEDNNVLNKMEKQYADALRDYLQPSQRELEKMAVDLAQEREELGKDFRYSMELNDIQKLRLFLKELYNKNVVKKLGITNRTSIIKLKSLISSSLSSLKPSVHKGRKIVNKMIVKGPNRFASTNLHLAFKRWWLWDKIESLATTLIKSVSSVVQFAFGMVKKIVVSTVNGIVNLVSGIVNGNLIPDEINENCYGFCVNGLTCNFIKMKCVPSPRGGLLNLGLSCFQNSIANIREAYQQFQENAKRKDVNIVDKVCASIGKPIIEGLYCVSPGLQFMSGFFDTVSVGLDFAGNLDTNKASVSLATGINKDNESFCSIDFCTGVSLSFGAGADVGVSLSFSRSEPEEGGPASMTYGLGFEILKLGAGISITFDDKDEFDGISFSLGTGISTIESPLKFSLEAMSCKTQKVFHVPPEKNQIKLNLETLPELTNQGFTKSFLNSGESLYAGEALVAQVSDDKAIVARLQADCNFVIYDHQGNLIFQSGTYKPSKLEAKSCKLKMEENGALNLYEDGKNIIWSPNSVSSLSTYQLVLQMSGHLIIYSGTERKRHWAQL